MTHTDFELEFDLLFNNALSNSAPEINVFEKSLFLTQAQEEIVKEAYDSKRNGTSFESSEAIRRRLDELAIPKTSTYDGALNNSLSGLKMASNSKFFKIENDAWYIVYEKVVTSNSELYVVPIALNQYSILEDNPFKNPNKERAWRLDLSNTATNDRVVEIITTQTPTSYKYRYLKEPEPIILANFDDVFPGAGLSINGVNTLTECKLNSEVHRIILKRAVELATMAYKENTLSNNLQLNNRNN